MALKLDKVKLTQTQKDIAEKILHAWSDLNKNIATLDIEGVRALLVYELSARARLTVVQRLTARYGVLEQRENEREVAKLLARKFANERK